MTEPAEDELTASGPLVAGPVATGPTSAGAETDPGGHVRVVPPPRRPEPDVDVVDAAALRAEAPSRWMNVPNTLTVLRLLLVPVILGLVVAGPRTSGWWVFGLFAFAAVTDTVDGWVARRWHGVTRWGQLADPIADKLLILGTLATLASLGELPWWAVVVIVLREVAVTLLRLRLMRDFDLVMPASAWGKAKTLSQVVAVAAYLIPRVTDVAQLTLLYLAIAFTVLSGIDYAFRAGRLARAVATGAVAGGGRSG